VLIGGQDSVGLPESEGEVSDEQETRKKNEKIFYFLHQQREFITKRAKAKNAHEVNCIRNDIF
jgi:hypothetical protein